MEWKTWFKFWSLQHAVSSRELQCADSSWPSTEWSRHWVWGMNQLMGISLCFSAFQIQIKIMHTFHQFLKIQETNSRSLHHAIGLCGKFVLHLQFSALILGTKHAAFQEEVTALVAGSRNGALGLGTKVTRWDSFDSWPDSMDMCFQVFQ